MQKILFDVLLREMSILIDIRRLLNSFGVSYTIDSIFLYVIAQRLLRVFGSCLQPKLDSAKKIFIVS